MANTKITSANLDTLTTLTVDDITIDGSTISDSGDLTLDVGGDIVLDAAGGDVSLKNAGNEAGKIVIGDATDGTIKITSSSSITLDAAGDIILDADGDDWKFHEGGTAVFEIKHESHGVDFLLNTGDEDWRFKGSDGGQTITALTLDMSEAGAATFNGKVGIGTNSIDHQLSVNAADFDGIQLLQGGTDTGYIGVYHDGSSTGRIYIGALSTIDFQTGNGGLTDGTSRMRINNTGVGIGTSSPSQQLSVVATGATVAEFLGESGPHGLRIYGNDAGFGAIGHVSSGSYDLTVNSSGNVGIGTGSQTERLTVNGQLTGGFGANTTSGTADYNHSTNARAGMGYTLLLGTATNGHGNSGYYHVLNFEYAAKLGTGNMTQMAIGYNVMNIYLRYRYSGSWSSWTQV